MQDLIGAEIEHRETGSKDMHGPGTARA
jgi:hypothetical protein